MISNIKIVKMNYFIKENWFIQVLSYCFKSNEIVLAFVLQYYIILLTKLWLFSEEKMESRGSNSIWVIKKIINK